MTIISIRGCHRCNPEEWKQVGPSSATYFCRVCRKEVNQILEWRNKSAQELKDRLEQGDKEIEGYSEMKDN